MRRRESARPDEGTGTQILAGEATRSVPRLSDALADPRHARRVRLHHLLKRRRRWARELDQLVREVAA
ncbi:MAG: hypothetical protein ACRDTM_07130 [Micromonosporaceae bacterium]